MARLESRALITTETAALDRRSVDVRLTPVARETLRRGTPLVHETVRHTVETLAAEGWDQDLLNYLQNGGTDGRPVAE